MFLTRCNLIIYSFFLAYIRLEIFPIYLIWQQRSKLLIVLESKVKDFIMGLQMLQLQGKVNLNNFDENFLLVVRNRTSEIYLSLFFYFGTHLFNFRFNLNLIKKFKLIIKISYQYMQ